MSLKHKIHVNAHYTRSVNLERDASSVDVISAYIPTSRALKLFKRVADSFYQQTMPRAWSLIGPYGSGKSSCSVFLSQLLSSPKLQATQIALEKLKETAPDIAKQFERETKKSSGYLQVLITGSPEPLWKKIVQGLSDAAENFLNNAGKFKVIRDLKELAMQKTSSIPDLLQQVEALQKTLASKNCKGICFVIDELGKFLEFEARHYGANDIYLLQSLAEHACKPSECNLFLFVLLHQSFEQYAKGLGESLKNEWSKVQGRFEDIPFLESAEQVLRIVGSAFSHKLTPKEKAGITEQIKTITQTMGECSALPGVIDEAQATKLFYSCYPLHPVSAILLPILCQKIAQNERTLFSYLGSREEFGLQNMIERMNTLNDLVCPHHIYDYFITNQPAALGDYTTHRRWAEVVTAIDRLGDAPDEQIRLLKTIGLLNIIGAKGGLKPSKQLLETCGKSKRAVANSLKALIDKSIITFRRFSGEYRVWQGSDFDLEEALQQSLDAIGQFSLATELNHINAFMPVVARRYTIKSGALRYFIPEFVDAQTYKLSPAKSVNPRIIFFLAMTQDDEKIFKQSVVQYYSPLDIVVLYLNGSQLRQAVAETLSLRHIQNTSQALNNDPIARREFEDRLTAAQNSEYLLLQRLQEQPQECLWFHHGKRLEIPTKRAFQEALSSVLDEVYSQSPEIHNELINRDKPSVQANAARNRLLEAMLVNPKDQDDLGIEKFPPEKAIYRSVLRETGLHNVKKKLFQVPKKSSSLYPVWQEIEKFLDSTEKEPRSFVILNERLMAPPYGVKAGVLPILYISAYLIYQNELALYEMHSYRPVMTDEILDRFVKRPDEFTFQRFKITGLRSSLYAEYSKIIKMPSKHVIQLVKPLAQLINGLPDYTKKTKSSLLSKKTRQIRDSFALAKSPEALMFEDIPKALGFGKILKKDNPNVEGLSQALQKCLKELKDAYPEMIKRQIVMLLNAFHMEKGNDLSSLRKKALSRYTGLEQHSVDTDGFKAFIKRITRHEGSDEEWLENILMFLAQKPTKKWTDADIAKVDTKLCDFSQRLLDLETLHNHHTLSREEIDGEFDIILLNIIKRGYKPVREVVAIDNKKKNIIQNCKKELFKILHSTSGKELQLAVLAELVNDFLASKDQSAVKLKHKEKLKDVQENG